MEIFVLIWILLTIVVGIGSSLDDVFEGASFGFRTFWVFCFAFGSGIVLTIVYVLIHFIAQYW